MALRKRGNIYWIDMVYNGKRYRFSTKTSDKKKAEEIHAKLILKLSSNEKFSNIQNTEDKNSSIKIESTLAYKDFFINKYLPYCYQRQSYYHIKKYFSAVLPEWFKKLKLSEIGTREVEMLQNYFLEQNKSIATCNRYISIFKASMSKAYDWGLISEQRLKNIRKVKPLKGENKRLRYLTEEEINRLLSCCDNHLYPIVYTALFTGMRKSEILNLKWNCIDFRNNLILLEKTKNNERREVPMTEGVKNLFRKLYSQRRLDTDHVFVNPDTGKRYTDIKRSFTTACRRAGIRDFHFHDLRHTFASHLVMNGVDLKTVQELLGHKSLTMTLRYSHLSQAHKKEAVKALENKLCHNYVTIVSQGKGGSSENP